MHLAPWRLASCVRHIRICTRRINWQPGIMGISMAAVDRQNVLRIRSAEQCRGGGVDVITDAPTTSTGRGGAQAVAGAVEGEGCAAVSRAAFHAGRQQFLEPAPLPTAGEFLQHARSHQHVHARAVLGSRVAIGQLLALLGGRADHLGREGRRSGCSRRGGGGPCGSFSRGLPHGRQ